MSAPWPDVFGAKWTHLTESDQGIDLDEAMQPAENDRYRPEYKIDGISDEVGDQLDDEIPF